MELTAKQRKVLVGLVRYYDEKGHTPTVREMAKLMGWRSHYSVQRILVVFRDAGLITEDHPRLWTLTPKGRRAAR